MALINDMELLGADINEGLQRLGGKVSFYERMLMKLPATVEKSPVLPFIEEGNIPQAISNAHALKGVYGNLSLTPLYKAYTQIVNDLRAGNPDSARKLYLEILPVQEQFMECIRKYQ